MAFPKKNISEFIYLFWVLAKIKYLLVFYDHIFLVLVYKHKSLDSIYRS